MKIAFIASSKDPASKIMYELLEGKGDLYIFDEPNITNEHVDEKLPKKYDLLIFLSKHGAKEHKKNFTVHSLGNFGPTAELGGIPGKLTPADAIMMKKMFLALTKAAEGTGYEATMEVTHHGPYTKTPALYVEIGSTEKEWHDKEAIKKIVQAVLAALKMDLPKQKIAMGIGGTHYCPNFNKLLLRTDYATAHICPKYALPFLDETLLQQMLENVDGIVLDWKGLGQEKKRVLKLIEKYPIERVQKLIS